MGCLCCKRKAISDFKIGKKIKESRGQPKKKKKPKQPEIVVQGDASEPEDEKGLMSPRPNSESGSARRKEAFEDRRSVTSSRSSKGKAANAGRQRDSANEDEEDFAKLEITIKAAQGLRDADWHGKSDPYCVCKVPHPTNKKKKIVVGQTHTYPETSNPIWNHKFSCRCKPEDSLEFGIFDKDLLNDELLGTVTLKPSKFMPFGFSGDLHLQETGHDLRAVLSVNVKVIEAPGLKEEEAQVDDRKRDILLEGLDFEKNSIPWKRAHAVVATMEGDEALAREETTSSALDTLVRLAESGLPIPREALVRVVACLQSTDRRYRLAALMICKALGRRVKPFTMQIAEVLVDNDEEVRTGAIKVLGTLGDAAAPHVTALGSLLKDEVPAVRSAALEALGVLSQSDCLQALVVLGQCLEHEDKRYRLACCLILKAVGLKATPHAYALAERIEKDPSIDVRIAACGTLGNIGAGAAAVQPALQSLYRVEDTDTDARVQEAAREAIDKLKKQGHPLPRRPAEDVTSKLKAAANLSPPTAGPASKRHSAKTGAASRRYSSTSPLRSGAKEGRGRGSSSEHGDGRGRGRGRRHDSPKVDMSTTL